MSGTGHSVNFDVAASGKPVIDGLMSGSAWTDAVLTYSFPASGTEYADYASSEPDGHIELTAAMKAAVRFALDTDDGNAANDGFALEGFTALRVDLVTKADAHLRLAQTSENPFGYDTAWGGYPWWNAEAGDVWFHTGVYDYTAPEPGTHNWRTFLHEIGHSLGLKHGHADEGTGFGTLPDGMDGYEYSLMTYRNFPGAGLGKEYGTESAPQTYMMADIAALQYLYGADFSTNSGKTTYSWSPDSSETRVDGATAITPAGAVIFATIWDGGGKDRYDLSAYDSNLRLDLRPGKSSLFSSDQVADLGDGRSAKGNIYNALQYEGDKRSLIEDATGGSGHDRITGNAAANGLDGRDGNDRIKGLGGRDTLTGGKGNDRLDGGAGADDLTGGKGRDILTGGKDADVFAFAKGFGRDVVRDFQDDVDELRLNDALWGGKAFSKAQILSRFASLSDGDTVLDFGRKGVLTLSDLDDPGVLVNDLVIV